jgi:hypothetical protein
MEELNHRSWVSPDSNRKPQHCKERLLRNLEGDHEWGVGNDVEEERRNLLEVLIHDLHTVTSVRVASQSEDTAK